VNSEFSTLIESGLYFQHRPDKLRNQINPRDVPSFYLVVESKEVRNVQNERRQFAP